MQNIRDTGDEMPYRAGCYAPNTRGRDRGELLLIDNKFVIVPLYFAYLTDTRARHPYLILLSFIKRENDVGVMRNHVQYA